jgi:hypothetical protein
MAAHALVGRDAGFLELRLLVNGILEGAKLALGQGNQETLKHHNGLSQAGVQVVVVRVYFIPHFLGIQGDSPGKVIGGTAKLPPKLLDHFLQSAYLMKELQPLGQKHAVQQAAHACRSLASLSLKIRRIEGRSVRNGSVMLGVFGQSAKQAGQRLGQQLAEAGGYAYSLQGFARVSQLP